MFHIKSKIRIKEKKKNVIPRLFVTTLSKTHILASLSHGGIFILLFFIVILY